MATACETHQEEVLEQGKENEFKEQPGTTKEPEGNTGPHTHTSGDLLYGVEDIPPWYQCLLFGFQHFLIFVGGTISTPLIVIKFMCMEQTDHQRGDIISSIIFVSGIVTLLQCICGIRLPIIQGANFAYIMPTITILITTFPSCESLDLDNLSESQKQEEWQIRMREVQGAITVSSVFQVIIGFTGISGFIMTWISPLTIVPTITMLGLSLFELGTKQAASHWGISALNLLLLVLVSQYMKNIKTPLPGYSSNRGFHIAWIPLFTYFPVLLVMCISWGLCGVLTAVDVLPAGSLARTDSSGDLLKNSPWFRLPYPGQWGTPTVSMSAVIGLAASVIASIIESIGDYYSCAKLCQTATPPVHAVNRGVGFEGVGCVLAGIFGTTSGTASYTSNIALIGVTKVASRRVVVVSAMIMIFAGLVSKTGAVFATIPVPVLGSTLMFMFSLITGVGLSCIKIIDLNSSRNHFVLGFSIFMGLSLPSWLAKNPDAIKTGSPAVDQCLTTLLQTSMFVGGMLGFILDNSIPGTVSLSYSVPPRWDWPRYVPFLPMFEGFRERKKKINPENMVATLPEPFLDSM
ncbi:Solute carrier family 23 member 1-like 4 [Homarus americanus]|uniref:Solute carrier family 23 member 1-like 4 n=1 Tax=Homarus americanus TaxID=6706 RepID=A0A8J5MSI9_HOMAM|nr:Solute carrier family 23 member 1-like 4 [Homarus americanus]